MAGRGQAFNAAVEAISSFLIGIGFTVEARPEGLGETFLDHIAILPNMTIAYDPKHLEWPGDLLHEAGHIAIIPSPFRSVVHGDIDASIAPLMDSWLSTHGFMRPDGLHGAPTEHPVSRAFLQCGEAEAQAWSYAAAVKIGLDPTLVFHPAAYDDEGAAIAVGFSMGAHLGVNGLVAAGMVNQRFRPGPQFPKLLHWLQPANATPTEVLQMEHLVYPGHGVHIAMMVMQRFGSLDEAMSPSGNGFSSALADSAIRGAGGSVSSTMHWLETARDEDWSAERLFDRLCASWDECRQGDFTENMGEGQEQAARLRPTFFDRYKEWRSPALQAAVGMGI